MPGMKDREIKISEIIPSQDRLVAHQETVRQSSDDESETVNMTVTKFVAHFCGHYKPYGFTCSCGKRFCRSCLESGRVWYCEECGVTLGPCCYRKRHDRKILCRDHWKTIDWSHPAWGVAGSLLGGLAFLAALGLALYLLNRFAR